MHKSDRHHLIISKDYEGQRLDRVLANAYPDLSRTRIQDLIKSGHVQVHLKHPVIASMKVALSDEIILTIPEAEEANPSPQTITLDIIYEDSDLLVINKSAGMVVHPAPGHNRDTLVNALLAHCEKSLSGIGGVKRPGIVHRLDKDTSGLIVVAKNDFAHHALSAQFSDRSLSRTYHALVWGVPTSRSGTIETLIGRHPNNRQKMSVVNRGGKEAVTHYKVIQVFGKGEDPRLNISLVQCKLATGRTHQIRVHLHHIGHPLIGDPVYGRAPKGAAILWPESIVHFPRQALHAREIAFIHPRLQEVMTFQAPLPDDMAELMAFL